MDCFADGALRPRERLKMARGIGGGQHHGPRSSHSSDEEMDKTGRAAGEVLAMAEPAR
jgi:hypothetical protein